MATNKKAKNSTKKTTGKGAAVIGPVAAPPEETFHHPGFKSFLTSAQFTVVVFLSVAITYLLDYTKAVSQGIDSNYCKNFIQDVEACSTTDVTMIRVKYYTGILTVAIVGLTGWTVRQEEPLLLRLISCLLLTPILSTVIALQVSKEWIHVGKNFSIGMMCTVLLVVGMSTFGTAASLAPWQSLIPLDVSKVTMVSLILVNLYETFRLGMEQTEGHVIVGDDGVTAPAKALMYFLCVDKTTIVAMLMFGLAFLNDSKRRYFLFYFAMTHLVVRYYHLVKMENDLLDMTYQNHFYFGSAMFSLMAVFIPTVSFGRILKEDAVVVPGEEKNNKMVE